jgi:hypothetical protein
MQERRGRTALRNAKSVRCTGVVISEQNNSTKSTACKGENGDLQHASLRWIEVNDVTWKLTDGVMERTPACHGKWPGFNVERGIAWAIDTGWPFKKPRWYARCGDQSYGPTKLDTARRAAMAFANGAKSFPRLRYRQIIHRPGQSSRRSRCRGRDAHTI